MSNVERRKALIAPSDEIMKKAANGNKAALQYMQQIGQVARILDDLVDRDHHVEPVNIIAVFRWLLVGCYKNSFFLANIGVLSAYHASALSAWEEAMTLEEGGEVSKMYAHVIKDFCLEIVPVVANLTGGYELMREIEHKTWQVYMEPIGG